MINDITGLGKVGAELVKAIRSATGVWYEPTKIKRNKIAEAEATIEANKILALGDIEKQELLAERAAIRLYKKAIHQQENIEAVIEKSIPLLEDNAKPEEVDNDWLNRFVDGAEKVSNEDARKLWSKILAGEANNPGSFSIRTLNTLTNIGIREAEYIHKLANHTLYVEDKITAIIPQVFISNIRDEFFFDNLMELESLGLLSLNSDGFSENFEDKNIYSKLQVDAGIHGKYLINKELSKVTLDGYLAIGVAVLTSVGNELLTFIENPDRTALINWLMSDSNDLGWKLEKSENS